MHRFLRTSILALTVSALPAWGLVAQPSGASRAELLRAERMARADDLEPPQRSGWEKFFYNSEQNLIMQKFQAGYRGFGIAFGGFPNGKGWLAAGIGFSDFAVGSSNPTPDMANRIDVQASATYSIRTYRQIGGRVAWRNIGGSPFAISTSAQWYDWPRRYFWGFGPDSDLEAESNYSVEGYEVGGDAWIEPSLGVIIGGGLHVLRPTTGPGTDAETPTIDEAFDPAGLPGYQEQTRFLRADAYIDLDLRDNPLYPRSGGRYTLRFADYSDRNLDRFGFRRYEVDLEQLLALQRKRKVLAFRALGIFSVPKDGNEVPFYYYPTAGSSRRLRGFESNRFQDRNLLIFTGEYRWAVWWPLDMALFVDVGNVAHERADLFDDMKVSYGFGFRMHGMDAFGFRTDFAWGDEGFRFHGSLNYPFKPGGLAR